jgi:hypothetical protein
MNSDSSHLVHDMQTEAISRSTFNLTQVAAGLPLASPTTKCLSHARMSTSDVKYLTSGRLLWCLWLHSLMNGVSPPSFSRSTRRQLAALDALRQPLGVGRMVPHIRRHTHSCRCLHTWSAYRRRCIARVSPAATFGTVTGVRVGGTTGASTGASVSADCQRVLASCVWRTASCWRRSRAAVHFASQRGSFSNALTRDAASPLVLHGRRVGRAACSAVVSSLEVVAEAALEVGGAVVEAVGPVRMSVVALGIDGRLRELVHAKGDKAETRGSHRV